MLRFQVEIQHEIQELLLRGLIRLIKFIWLKLTCIVLYPGFDITREPDTTLIQNYKVMVEGFDPFNLVLYTCIDMTRIKP
jgi:hypothetical protein